MEGTDYSFLGSHLEKNKPLTERQQMALLLQMSSESPKCDKEAAQRNIRHVSGSPSTPKSMLRRNQRGETPLHVAAIKGDQKRIKQLLADGAPVDATDFAGWTPLHEAANRGHFEACRVLLQNGANSNALGLDSFTPLHDACINGHFPVVHLLLQHGADPKLPNIQGKTPIDVAGTPVIYRILTEFKPEIDISLVSSPKENSKTSSLKSNNQWGEETGLWTPPSQKTSPNRPKLASSLRRGLAESWAASDHTYGKLDPNLEGVSLLPLTPESTNGKRMNWADCLSDSDTENNDIVYRQRPSPVSRTSKKSLLQENNALEQAIPIVPGEKLLSYSSQSEFDPFKSTLLFAMENKDGVNGEPNNPDTRNKDGTLKMEDKAEGEMKSEKDEHNNKEESGLKRCADQLTEEEPEEDGRRKRKKEESKETTSKLNTASSARTGKNNPKTKQTKQPANSVTNSSATVATSDRKSPHTLPEGAKGGANTQTSVTVTQSPKRPLEDSDEDSKKSSDSHSSSSSSQSGPKVPPLKIVLNVEHETGSTKSGKNGGGRLPYVVSAEEKDKSSEVTQNCTGKDTVDAKTTSAAVAENANSNSNDSSSSCVGEKQTGGRVTRSSQRAAASLASQSPSPTPNSTNTPSPVNQATETEGSEGKERSTSPKTTENVPNKEEKTGGTVKREEDGEANQKVVGTGSTGSMHATGTQPTLQSVVDVHPRKRKLRPKETEPPVANETAPVQAPVPPEPAPATNCYEMYLHIRRQIDRRRKNLFPIQPKPPQGFKDYLMNRCTYVLAGNSASRLSVPVISPPPSLPGAMRDLFTEQEKERYKLRMQHLIEKEKLVLSVEQEILRVHGRAARALANQALPFSVCTLLRDEEVYSAITPEQEEKDRNARSRYNGRLFLSWLQDVDDKWEKIKEAMLLRHHNEAESLHAVQKMDWEWKLKEMSLCEPQVKPTIDDLQVPMVHVSDDFDLLPA